MKITGVAGMTAITGMIWSNAPAYAAPAAEQEVTVCMTYTPDAVLQIQAKMVASAILASAGVKLQWHEPNKCPAEAILITLSSDVPARFMPGALAYALPFDGTHIVVFYDRVKNDRVKNRPGYAQSVLGHVIAHEITHILQGAVWHSETGIMKPQWSRADFMAMIGKPLHFTEEDVERMQRGLLGWEARRASGRGVHAPVALQ
jgi:hypothetical protein